jgi:hypothetical protein
LPLVLNAVGERHIADAPLHHPVVVDGRHRTDSRSAEGGLAFRGGCLRSWRLIPATAPLAAPLVNLEWPGCAKKASLRVLHPVKRRHCRKVPWRGAAAGTTPGYHPSGRASWVAISQVAIWHGRYGDARGSLSQNGVRTGLPWAAAIRLGSALQPLACAGRHGLS